MFNIIFDPEHNVSFDSFLYELLLYERRENKIIIELLNNYSLIGELEI